MDVLQLGGGNHEAHYKPLQTWAEKAFFSKVNLEFTDVREFWNVLEVRNTLVKSVLGWFWEKDALARKFL